MTSSPPRWRHRGIGFDLAAERSVAPAGESGAPHLTKPLKVGAVISNRTIHSLKESDGGWRKSPFCFIHLTESSKQEKS
eukprot:XP_025000285.1 uncharacterized protein LOC112530471 isoform X3 [Gallus gallus]